MESETNTEQKSAEGAKAAEEKLLPQSQVNDIVARENKKLAARYEPIVAEFEALKKRVAELDAEKQAAEEAKLSATQRAELERKREREAYEKRIADLDTSAKTEREKRHALLIESAASQRVAAVAPKLFNPQLTGVVAREIASLLRVEVGEDGAERVVAVMGSEQDREPLDTAWQKIERDRLAPFFKAEGGAGARHGSGTGGGSSSWAGLSASDKIAAGLQARRTG